MRKNMISTGIGNVALDPVLDGNLCKVRLACMEKNKTGTDRVHFFNMEFYGTAAEYAYDNFYRGDCIWFEATAREKKLTVDDKKISTVVFRVNNFKIVSKKEFKESEESEASNEI